jgi:predicted DNA-binding transcriptional regulator YafY
VGRRTGTETAIALLTCFTERPTWKQADLARRLVLTPGAVRRRLVELQEAGIPLEREDDPPHVYWSVPKKGFLPGTVRLEPSDAHDLVRLLARLPRSAMRARLMQRVLDGYVGQRPAPKDSVVVPLDVGLADETWLALVEDGAARGEVLEMRYLSASRGAMETRQVSPQRVVVDAHTRFMAVCHKSGTLKWFRVDRITNAKLLGPTGARAADPAQVDAAIATSVNGFRTGEDATDVAFFVRDPEARWVIGNLPSPLVAEATVGGIRVTGRTAAVVQVARFVVGLGGAASCESHELRAVVRDLAEGALAAALGGTERVSSRTNRSVAQVTK